MDENLDDLLSLSPANLPQSILKPTCGDNFILLQTPIHKNLKVSFKTPGKTPVLPLGQSRQHEVCDTKSVDWVDIKQLDDELRWKERIEVVTKCDHEDYTKLAKEFLEEIISHVVEHKARNVTSSEPISSQEQYSPCFTTIPGNLAAAHPDINLVNSDSAADAFNSDKENVKPHTGCIKSTPRRKGTNRLRKPGVVRRKSSISNSDGFETETSDSASFSTDSISTRPDETSSLEETEMLSNYDENDFLLTTDNPFDSKDCLANSPISEMFSQSKPSTDEDFISIGNRSRSDKKRQLDFINEEIDPFATRNCLANSPVQTQTPSLKEMSEDATKPVSPAPSKPLNSDLEISNPFETRSCLSNSPLSTMFTNSKQEKKAATDEQSLHMLEGVVMMKDTEDEYANSGLIEHNFSSAQEGETGHSVLTSGKTEKANNPRICPAGEYNPSNIDGEEEDGFKDATSLVSQGFDFNLDYLETVGSNQTTSDLRKQSLYLKFDPLVSADDDTTGRSLIGRKSDIIDLTGNASLAHLPKPLINKELEAVRTEPDLLCDSPSKFMEDFYELNSSDHNAMVFIRDLVIPSGLSQEKIQLSSTEMESLASFHKASDASETPSQESVDDILQVLKYSEADLQRLQLPLTDENASLKAEVESEREKLSQMQVVMQQFEDTMMEMAQKYDEEKKNDLEKIETLTKNNERTQVHLESVEKAYLELLQRCEQMKTGISNYKVNEETYKKVFEEYKSAHEASQQRYKALKLTMEENIQKLQSEHGKKEQEFKSQLAGLKARCKFLENQTKSIQSQLEQKTNENEELTKICDELIEQRQVNS